MRPQGLDVALVVLVVLAAAFYCWTAATSYPFDFRSDSTDIYNQLTDSILAGHASYPVRPPAGLLRLSDPYDPIANEQYRGARLPGAPSGIHDLSLYKGKLYTNWGLGPALALFLPWRLLPVGELPQSLGVAIFAILGLVFGLLLLRLLVRRLFSNAPAWTVLVGAIGLAFGSAVPFMLRRPAAYEVAIAAGACFLAAGLYLVARALSGERARTGQLAGASLCFGLAFNSRPPLIVAGGVLLGLALIGRPLHANLGERPRAAVALLAPFTACVVLTLAWNAVRFDSPFEFGLKYQLAGVETAKKQADRLSYLPPGIYSYALAPPRLTVAFPYVSLPPPPVYPGPIPSGYLASAEPTGGIAASSPIVLFALALPFLWRRRRAGERTALAVAATLVGLGAAIMTVLAFIFWTTTERYEVDFDLLLILGGLLVWLAMLCRSRTRVRHWLTALAGTLALLWSVFCGVLVSITGYDDLLAVYHRGTYVALQNATAPLPTLVAMLVGRPLIASVTAVLPVNLPAPRYTTFTAEHASTAVGIGRVTLTVYSGGSEDLALQGSVRNYVCPTRPTGAARTSPGITRLCSVLRTYDCKAAPRAFSSCSGRPATAAPARLSVLVRSPDRAPVTVPAMDGVQRFPIHLHWGLNRIILEATGAIGVLQFNDIVVAAR